MGKEWFDVGIDPPGWDHVRGLVAVVKTNVGDIIALLHKVRAACHILKHRAGLLPPGIVCVEMFAGVVSVAGQAGLGRIVRKGMEGQSVEPCTNGKI